MPNSKKAVILQKKKKKKDCTLLKSACSVGFVEVSPPIFFLFCFFSKYISCLAEVQGDYISSALESAQASNIWDTAPTPTRHAKPLLPKPAISPKKFPISLMIKQIKVLTFCPILDVSVFIHMLSFSFGIPHTAPCPRFFSWLKTRSKSAYFGTISKSLIPTTKSLHRNPVSLFLFPHIKHEDITHLENTGKKIRFFNCIMAKNCWIFLPPPLLFFF